MIQVLYESGTTRWLVEGLKVTFPPPSEAPPFQEKKYKEYLTIFSEEDFFGKTPFFPMFEFSLQSFGHETKVFPVGGSVVQVTFVSWHHCIVFIFDSCCHFWSGDYG